MSAQDLAVDATVDMKMAAFDLAEAVRKLYYAGGSESAVADLVRQYDVARSIVVSRCDQ